jgi:hypothetical protein
MDEVLSVFGTAGHSEGISRPELAELLSELGMGADGVERLLGLAPIPLQGCVSITTFLEWLWEAQQTRQEDVLKTEGLPIDGAAGADTVSDLQPRALQLFKDAADDGSLLRSMRETTERPSTRSTNIKRRLSAGNLLLQNADNGKLLDVLVGRSIALDDELSTMKNQAYTTPPTSNANGSGPPVLKDVRAEAYDVLIGMGDGDLVDVVTGQKKLDNASEALLPHALIGA